MNGARSHQEKGCQPTHNAACVTHCQWFSDHPKIQKAEENVAGDGFTGRLGDDNRKGENTDAPFSGMAIMRRQQFCRGNGHQAVRDARKPAQSGG
jgi:hypothetical protein